MAGEQKLQTKIMKWLKDNGFYAVKVVMASKNGVPDIIGCSPAGHFFAIEVKFGANKASRLQEWNIAEINKRGGNAIVAYSLDQVKQVLQNH